MKGRRDGRPFVLVVAVFCLRLAAAAFGSGWFCRVVVVLLVVDLLAVLVLLAIDLGLLSFGQCAAVGGAFVVDLLGYAGLVGIGSGGFAGGHLAAAQAVGDALILIGQHGVYCASTRNPSKPALDLEAVLAEIGGAKELIQSVMEQLRLKSDSPTQP